MCGPCCPNKPVKQLKIGGQIVGISGFDEIMTRGLAHLDETDEGQKKILLDELKKQNFVPESLDQQYLDVIWAEFKPLRARKMGWVDDKFHGIPREEIEWHPTIDYSRCSSCETCFKFCKRRVFTFDDKPRVTNPHRCVVTCTGCKSQCKENAISFPSLVDLREELKILREKYKLTENP